MGQVGAHEFYANQFPAEVPPDFELNSLSQILWFVLRTHSNGLDGALLQALTNTIYRFKRIGLEAGPLSQWLYSVLAEAGLPVICVETRHMRAVLKAQINKTDRNDARGMAQMMRAGLYRPVHVKTLRSQKLRALLTHRKLLQSKAIERGAMLQHDVGEEIEHVYFPHSGMVSFVAVMQNGAPRVAAVWRVAEQAQLLQWAQRWHPAGRGS
jgi:hypothetical protein